VPGEGLFFPVNHFGCGGYLAIFHKNPPHITEAPQKIASIILGWASLKPLAPELALF